MEKQTENERKANLKNIIIIVAALLVLGIGGCIVTNKFTPGGLNGEEMNPPNANLNNVANAIFAKEEKFKLYAFGDVIDDSVNSFDVENKLNNMQLYALSIYFLSNKKEVTTSNVDRYVRELYNLKLTEYPDLPLCGVKFDKNRRRYVKDKISKKVKEIKPLMSNIVSIEDTGTKYAITLSRIYPPVKGKTPENAFYIDSQYKTKAEALSQFTSTDKDGKYSVDSKGAIDYYRRNFTDFVALRPLYKLTFKKHLNDYYLVRYETIY